MPTTNDRLPRVTSECLFFGLNLGLIPDSVGGQGTEAPPVAEAVLG